MALGRWCLSPHWLLPEYLLTDQALFLHFQVSYRETAARFDHPFLVRLPPTGGDTAYVSQVEAYKRLSPSFQATSRPCMCSTLASLRQSTPARATVEGRSRGSRWRQSTRWFDVSIPKGLGHVAKSVILIGYHLKGHPVTGEKALYVNKQFSRHIVGLKQEESEAILNLL